MSLAEVEAAMTFMARWLDILGPAYALSLSVDHSCHVLSREEEFSSGPSFETISASGLNAALAHYRYFRRRNFLGPCGAGSWCMCVGEGM